MTINLKAAILCGGMATRLYPQTETKPKSLITIGGKPFIHHQITQLKKQGVSEFILCIGNMGDQIRTYCGNGSKWDIKIQYSEENIPMGTAGALRNAYAILPDVFVVVYGDTYPDIKLEDMYNKYQSTESNLCLSVYNNKNTFLPNNIEMVNGNIMWYNKGGLGKYIDYGITIMNKGLLMKFKENISFDLSEVFQRAITDHTISAYDTLVRPHEIGTINGIRETEAYLVMKRRGL